MKKRYNKQIRILSKFKPIVRKWLLPIYNFILGLLIKDLRNDKEVTVKKYKVNKTRVWGFLPRKETETSLIYFHGGAFYMKASPYQYKLTRMYAKKANIKVFFVEYKLAPKHKYPTPVLEGLDVYKWLIQSGLVNPHKIGVGGDSAGGSIAACLTVKTIKEGLPKPYFQFLVYPVIDDKMQTESMRKYDNTPMWNSKLNKQMWEYYIGETKYESPLDNITAIPTFIEVEEYDCLRDEAILFSRKLIKAGTKVTLNKVKGTMHGYDILYKKEIAQTNIKKRIKFLKIYSK